MQDEHPEQDKAAPAPIRSILAAVIGNALEWV